jgi:hypothetical protein
MLTRLMRAARRIVRVLAEPVPARFLALRKLDKTFDFLSYPQKLRWQTVERRQYGYPLLQAARLARELGRPGITAIEFGVAGGNGLVALERHAERVAAETGVEVNIYGFDAGIGLPAPLDYRDAPYLFQAGYYAMDTDALRGRLKSAKLILGPVEETVPPFLAAEEPPPIGFVAFDLDYYSSTLAALRIFDADGRHFLPRVACYFDDVLGDIYAAHSEFAGELLAIKEFNAAHTHIKITHVRGVRFAAGLPEPWHDQIFVAHLFEHRDYGHPVNQTRQMPLRRSSPAKEAAGFTRAG